MTTETPSPVPARDATRLLRVLLLITAVLLVPILPFLAFGSAIDAWFQWWQAQPASEGITALLVVGILATDILLPVPSSFVSTVGGIRLGWWAGTLASWAGMSAGAAIGFALARTWGHSLALRFTRESDLAKMQTATNRLGALVLVVARGVPVLAEASVLLMGIQRMAWRRFLPPVLLSNLGLALAYSAFGDIASHRQWLPMALGVSVALPVLLATMMQRWLSRNTTSTVADGVTHES